MELFTVPRGSYVRLLEDGRVPPAASELHEGETIFFDHIDGMYSFCRNAAGEIVHLVAWAEVEVVSDPKWPRKQSCAECGNPKTAHKLDCSKGGAHRGGDPPVSRAEARRREALT